MMRGGDERTGEVFIHVDLEKRVRSDHPSTAIRGLVNEALVALGQKFAALYAPIGRPDPAGEAASSSAVAKRSTHVPTNLMMQDQWAIN
jgi:transposase